MAGIKADCIDQPVQTSKLGVPACVYFLQNMALQFSSANLPAAIFQVLYNGKTLVVAMFSVSMLNKTLTKAKWFALALMGAGLAMVQLGAGKESSQKDMGNGSEQSIALGLGFVLFGCMCSGFAGVYFEKMMKPQPNPDGTMPSTPSMWMKNMQLSFFTLLIGVFQIMFVVPVDMSQGALRGFTTKVWVMVWNNALGGLLVAMVIKYADNILKGFACALATVLATLLSVPLFGFQIGLAFMAGTGIVVYSTLLYGGTVKMPAATGNPEKWNEEFEVCSVFKGNDPEQQSTDSDKVVV
jgi:UDP-galactose transporter